MYEKITRCRICENEHLVPVLDLGEQMLTGVFPTSPDEAVTVGPLRLVKCHGEDACGLLQLEHSYSLGEMYGDNYGYRSGLNPSMVAHLRAKVARILARVPLREGDVVVDIGSNDGTTLAAYPSQGIRRIGIDPTATKFAHHYPEGSEIIPDFFSGAVLAAHGVAGKARVVTSFSMFYDLEAPLDFMREVYSVLADDGIWVFEQSYMPTMLEMNSYDTACHEHLEYYALRQVAWMADRVGFVVIDVEFNDVNGGSFSVTAGKAGHGERSARVDEVLADEVRRGLDTLEPYARFADRVARLREQLRDFCARAAAEGKTIAALGASTKGNVLLQYCGLGPEAISAVAEVNPEKFGRRTPGTWIPILPEDEVLAGSPDYLLVLPWHFRGFFMASPRFAGRTLVFPLPTLEVVRRDSLPS
ncbi:class I SAM-dependent methyltransferase [Arenimonas alkanexedens]